MNFDLGKLDDICSVCQSQPQDMLILACRHNLCLDCATQVYNINPKQDKLLCQICLIQTKLDNDTIICLRSLSTKNYHQNINNHNNFKPNIPTSMNIYNNNINMKNNNNINMKNININNNMNKANNINMNKIIINNDIQNREQFQIVTNLYKQQQSHQVLSNSNIKCQKHTEPLMYFCFDCNNFKICSQCILTQNHLQHKILTLKKSKQQIEQNISKMCNQKLKIKKIYQKDQQNLINKKNQSQKQYQKNINYLQNCFNQIIILVQKRYNQLKQKLQKQSLRKLQIIQGAIDQIGQKINLIDLTIKFQQQLNNVANQQNPYRIFQYYTNQLTQGYDNINFEPNLPNFIQQIHQQQINKQYYLKQIKQILHNIQFIKDIKDIKDNHINYMSYIQQDNDQNLKDITLDQQIHQYRNQEKLKLTQNKTKFKSKQEQNQTYNNNDKNQKNQKNKYNNNLFIQQKQAQNYKKPQNSIPYPNNQKQHKQITQNINIIQSKKSNIKSKINQLIQNPITQNRQTLQTLKRKARENIKNKQLTNSRKLQLSRSLINVNDIINKIQQRTSKI